MLNDRRNLALVPMAILAVVCTALGLAWVLEPAFAPTMWPARLGLVIGGAALVLGTIRLALVQSRSAALAAERYIDRLCELDSTSVKEDRSAIRELRSCDQADRFRGAITP